MSRARYMAGLLWLLANDPDVGPAEFIVRAARPTRWSPKVRFEAGDVDRCARAIGADPKYRDEVVRDAISTAMSAGGLGVAEVVECERLVEAGS